MKHGFLVSISLVALATPFSVRAQAADDQSIIPEAPAADRAGPEDDIIVTGSRIARPDYSATSPIISQSQEALQNTGQVSIEASLNQLPQFVPAQDAATNTVGNSGRATLDLRGLGDNRNLILIDGRRVVPSDGNGTVDVNIIPRALIESVEVISGGASAVYGSDAISGVVNFKTRRKFTGLAADLQTGATTVGDGNKTDLSLAGGTEFAGGRGHVMASIGYSERSAVQAKSRSFFDRANPNLNITQGRFLPGSTNLPTQAALNTVFGRYGVRSGAVRNTVALGFNDNGSLFSTSGGVQNYHGPGIPQFSDTVTTVSYNATYETARQTPLKRYTGFGKFDYELTDDLSFYAVGLYADTRVDNINAPALSTYTMPVTNPFIPADLRTILASRPNPNAPFSISKRFQDIGNRIIVERFETYQLTAGFSGNLGLGDITWNLYGSYGKVKQSETSNNALSITAMQNLLNARDGGASLCSGGYDIFGLDSTLSDSCLQYVLRTPRNDISASLATVEGTAQGKLFTLPAGDVRFALTGSYRRNTYKFQPDPLAAISEVSGAALTIVPTSGHTEVYEAAAEVLVPVLRDLPAIKELNVGAAYRYSQYDTVGGVSTYKADLDWRIVDALRIRGGYQRAIRAPTVNELFGGAVRGGATVGSPAAGGGEPCDVRGQARTGPNGAQVRALCIAQGLPTSIVDTYVFASNALQTLVGGNPAVEEETADTFTIGGVFSPSLSSPVLKRFSLSVDYYNISIKDAIASVPAAQALQKCFNLDGSNPSYSVDNIYCTFFRRNPDTGLIIDVTVPYVNIGAYKTSGIDIQADWLVDLDGLGVAGDNTLRFNLAANYLDEFRVQLLAGDPFQDWAGSIGSPVLPRWKGLATVTYASGGFALGTRIRYIHKMKDRAAVTTTGSTVPGVPAYTYVDLNARYKVNESYELRAGLTNVFDKKPPIVAGQPGSTNASVYDVIGRQFFIGAGITF